MRIPHLSWRHFGLPAAALCAGLALVPVPAGAAENADSGQTPSDMAREGLEQMMRALRLLVESIPQYELPEVLDNGDIIIRRKRGDTAPKGEPEIDETAT